MPAFQKVVASLGFTMTPADEADYLELVKAMEAEVLAVEAMPDYVDPRLMPAPAAATRTYERPAKADNPLNAWSHKVTLSLSLSLSLPPFPPSPPSSYLWACTHKRQFTLQDDKAVATGILGGRPVVLKDTVSVAGIPLTLGTHPFQLTADTPWPVPTIDAPIVQRLIAAGGVVAGTATCESFCMSGLSDTSAVGPVENPWLRGFSAGGSSSGCGVLTALKLVRAWRLKRGLSVDGLPEGVDFAIGGDQGGSIRLVGCGHRSFFSACVWPPAD